MRKFLFLLAFTLVGCGDDFNEPESARPQAQHAPEIIDVVLTPDSVTHMEGNGSVLVTAEISFKDIGLDIRSLRVKMPDGPAIEFQVSAATETGTFTEEFVISTEKVGGFSFEFWLVDDNGARSINHRAGFEVAWIAQSSDWTNRLGGLPHALHDVVWSGNAFIAVGEGGEILTSADGIDWVVRDSYTHATLNAVSAYGSEIVAVGDEIILLSTDHGQSWMVKDMPNAITLRAVAVNSSQFVVGGIRDGSAFGFIGISEDRGDTWQAIEGWPGENYAFNDLAYADGLFVAPTQCLSCQIGLRPGVKVSTDGKVWNEIEVSDEGTVLHTIIHDGSQFILAGWAWSNSMVFTSPDGSNWTELQTPVRGASYHSAAWNGSKLVLAGGSVCGMGICFGDPEVPHGIASTDGGATWEMFSIDGDYLSAGMAWGNGRFVSVGYSTTAYPFEGAIYTAE